MRPSAPSAPSDPIRRLKLPYSHIQTLAEVPLNRFDDLKQRSPFHKAQYSNVNLALHIPQVADIDRDILLRR
jgi:hypothetical protein